MQYNTKISLFLALHYFLDYKQGSHTRNGQGVTIIVTTVFHTQR